MLFAKFDPKNIPERINCCPMKLGRCYPADVINMDPIQEISPYRGPVLIIHGTKDAIVAPDYSRQAQHSLPNAKLHFIEGGAHGFRKKHDAIAMAHLRRFAGQSIEKRGKSYGIQTASPWKGTRKIQRYRPWPGRHWHHPCG